MIVLDRRILKERLDATRQKLTDTGCDALVLYAPGSVLGNGTQAHGYMRYLCDWDGYNTPSVLVVFPDAGPVLFVTNIFLQMMSESGLWGDDVRFHTPPTLGQAVAALLTERIGMPKKLAYIGKSETPVPFWEALTSALGGVPIMPFEPLLDTERVVKDALQMTMHKRAAEICDDMFQELYRKVGSGKPVYRIQADLDHVARSAGAEFVQTWLTVTPHADYCRFRREECQRVPQKGDQVILGIYLYNQGHWGHAIRMGGYGTPKPEHLRAFDIVLEMQEEAMARLIPGKNLYDVQAGFKSVIAKHFSPEERKGLFQFRSAHGLGHSYEDPLTSLPFPQDYLAPAESSTAFMEIVPGMLFELHPNFFQKGVAGGCIGDMAYITETGPVLLNTFPREFIHWGA